MWYISLILLLVLLFEARGFGISTTNAYRQTPRNSLVMRERKCDITGRRQNSKAMAVSKSNVHTHRVQHVNLQTKKFWWEEGNKFVRVRVSTRTMKTIAKKGLDKLAKEYDVDLNKFAI